MISSTARPQSTALMRPKFIYFCFSLLFRIPYCVMDFMVCENVGFHSAKKTCFFSRLILGRGIWKEWARIVVHSRVLMFGIRNLFSILFFFFLSQADRYGEKPVFTIEQWIAEFSIWKGKNFTSTRHRNVSKNRNEIGEMKENTVILTTEKNRFTLTTFVVNQTTNLLRHTNCIHCILMQSTMWMMA